MSKISKKQIYWNAVEGQDVVGYNVYVAPFDNVPFSYTLPHITEPQGTGQLSVVAPDDFPAGTFDEDIIYGVYITAVDDVGNESDPLALSAPFDFVAPSQPTGGGVRDI